MSNKYFDTIVQEFIEEFGGEATVRWQDLGMDVDNLSQTAVGKPTEATLERIGKQTAGKIRRHLAAAIEEGGESAEKVKAALGIED